MSRIQFTLTGTKHDLVVEFPWEQKVFISVVLVNKEQQEIERWERPISDLVWNHYYMWIQIAKIKLEEILQ